ncbi:D-alanine--D-alanine ligase [Acerihabitans arboris]|uniref:D-alanine--D-alanine ligase n=1 Tax=Acerihabitans arboris TaxID=2691583 RepID=A0A845SES5_9GAMM|nr:D-alanine--D-alanine ligase [Acerihabitans arboris]NDL63290.1 D-alanine--D-alanine ligase [Acerihabitans arboris]
MAKIRVGVIFGGKSAEHEVSLQSAKNIVENIDRERFDVTLLGIDKQGIWHVNDASDYLLNQENPARIALNPSTTNVALVPGQASHQLIESHNAGALDQLDVIFPIVHGTLGEDGSLQGLLRMANIPFVGSGVLGSAMCMDKDVAKRLLRDAGLPVAPFVTLTRANIGRHDFSSVIARLGLPLFIKPANQGSSIGVSKVGNEAEYHRAVELAFRYDHKVVVEEAITGREIECSVLGNEQARASLCGEIILSDEFYTYETKYINEQGATVAIPADIPTAVNERIRGIAIKAFQALECQGMARVDLFLTPAGDAIINEVNTLPGFTNISMYPKLWEASGISYAQLITTLVELALERHRLNNQLHSTHLPSPES